MCELYAINSLRPTRANEHLRLFYQDSVQHPHGWGLAWREGSRVFLHKEDLRAIDSNYLSYLLDEPIRSTNVVAHIRQATRGILSYNNCHPFMRRDAYGTRWIIAHNGTVLDDRLIDGYQAYAVGNTDSEQVVIYLIDALDEVAYNKGEPLLFDERFVLLAEAVRQLSRKNKLNLVIDDGVYTYVHTNTVLPTLYVRVNGTSAHFCTRPLGDEDAWEPVPANRLIAYRGGRIVRMGARHEYSIDDESYLRAVSTSMEWQHG